MSMIDSYWNKEIETMSAKDIERLESERLQTQMAYVYAKSSTSNTWENFGYVLFSKGSDSNSTLGSIATDGIIDPDHRTTDANIDNIYSGE